ncbi:hypothetical protein [Spiroplasma endosymbiont of Polydrusus pterygomalis]|uniref:hypothetical protein n=1 Tax=Spiroplasma endosymbiont of Polydrusus pterygomalis TaxID=3139327 RepID=UPI003CCB2A46
MILGFTTVTAVNLVACSDYQDVKFNYENIIPTKNLQTETQDNNGNLYYATFDNATDIGIPGEKIWKYNVNTKMNEIYWENKNFKVGSFNMAVDSKGNIYLGSAGGVQILFDKNKFITMPLVTNMTTNITYFKNNLYITTFDGFYKYNIDTKNTKKIDLPNNSIVNYIFIDKNENIYLGVYKSINFGALIIKKDELVAKPITGDDFFNANGVDLIAEINNKIYFYSLNRQSKKAKLYYSDLSNTKLEYLLDLPVNVEKIFNVNNKIGLIIQENKNCTIQVLNITDNSSLEKKFEIKNNFYNQIIQNFKILYLSNKTKIDCLSW